MKLKEITPKAYQCGSFYWCPAVYEIVGEDRLVIIGKKVESPDKLGISKKIGKDEQAVIVDKEMLRQIFR